MRIYRILAALVALEVVVQAAAMAYGMSGLGHWVYDEGHVATKATFEEGGEHYTGAGAFALHGLNGALLIPILALVFLLVAVLTRKSVPGGLRWAAIVVGLVALQVFLGFMTLEHYRLGALHGANALALFGAASYAAVRRPVASSPATSGAVSASSAALTQER